MHRQVFIVCQVLLRAVVTQRRHETCLRWHRLLGKGRGLSLIHQTQRQEAHQGWHKAKATWFLIWLELGFFCSSHGLALHPQFAAYKVILTLAVLFTVQDQCV